MPPVAGGSQEADARGLPPREAGLARPTAHQALTLVGIVALVAITLIFDLDVGLVALSVAAVLGLFAPKLSKEAADGIKWPVVLLIHGMAPTRPPTALIRSCTNQSTVPLRWAIANRYVTPTRTTKMSPGKTPKMSSAVMSAASVPTRNAAVNASTPMFIDSPIATAKTATSARMETTSVDMLQTSSLFFMTLPMALRGSRSTNLTSRGRLCGASCIAT
jgi:hypothetical protein